MGSVHDLDFGSKRDDVASAAMDDLVRALGRVVEMRIGGDATFAEREVVTLQVSNMATRGQLEQELQRVVDAQSDDLLINGVRYKQSHEPTTGKYHSLCGTLEVQRATYREVGVRNGPTVVPLELEVGMVERATPALGYSISLEYANKTSREYVESMAAAHREVPSRSTIERIGKAVGTKAKALAPSIERYIRQSEKVPEEAVAISVGLDRTSVPYEEERAEGEPPKTGRKERTKPYVRTPPAPVDVNYRMDYVGTITLVDADGEKMVTRKYAATHEEGSSGILKRMMADIRGAKRQRPDLQVGIVQDGAPELWSDLERALTAEPSVDEWLEAIDRYHLSERLGDVATVTEPNPEMRELLIEQWDQDLADDDAAIDRIEHYIDERLWWFDGKELETLQETLTYIQNNGDRMRYVTIREAGLPIGSGITEGSCKSLTGTRVKRSGQRWHDAGVSAVLTLRAIHQSERLPRFWNHLSRRYIAKVEKAAA